MGVIRRSGQDERRPRTGEVKMVATRVASKLGDLEGISLRQLAELVRAELCREDLSSENKLLRGILTEAGENAEGECQVYHCEATATGGDVDIEANDMPEDEKLLKSQYRNRLDQTKQALVCFPHVSRSRAFPWNP